MPVGWKCKTCGGRVTGVPCCLPQRDVKQGWRWFNDVGISLDAVRNVSR